MKVTINNYDELLEFIKREDVNSKQATEVVCKVLKVISIFEMTKKELINATEYCINTFYKNVNSERPIFLCQKSKDFNIKDIYNN